MTNETITEQEDRRHRQLLLAVPLEMGSFSSARLGTVQ